MKKVISLITFIAVSLAMTSAFAGTTANHTVTVDVTAINEVSVSGNVTLTVSSATAGQDPNTAQDSAGSLSWTTNEAAKKITVETDLTTPQFALAVQALNTGGGTAAGSVTLTTTAQALVTGISMTTGSAELQYTATATAADGTGSDLHSVTYTITAE